MLGKLLNFRRKRTLSPHADDKAVEDFTRVCKQQGLNLDFDSRAKRIKEIMYSPPEQAGDHIEELAQLLGQSEPKGKW